MERSLLLDAARHVVEEPPADDGPPAARRSAWSGTRQVDPKTEYKREGMKEFDAMWEGVARQGDRERLPHGGGPTSFAGVGLGRSPATHDAGAARRGGGRAGEQARATNAGRRAKKPEPIRNRGDKVGRNDPCPCGSGKKYKNCHMRQQAMPGGEAADSSSDASKKREGVQCAPTWAVAVCLIAAGCGQHPVTRGISEPSRMVEIVLGRVVRSEPRSRRRSRSSRPRGLRALEHKNGAFGDRRGIDYLYCDRTESVGFPVTRRWQIAIVHRDGKVTEVLASTGLVGP